MAPGLISSPAVAFGLGDAGEAPLLNGGPYVAATAAAIDEMERLPEVTAGDFELRVLKVPGLHLVAVWLVGPQRLVRPLSPAPRFLDATRSYTEEQFADAVREPARRVLEADANAGG